MIIIIYHFVEKDLLAYMFSTRLMLQVLSLRLCSSLFLLCWGFVYNSLADCRLYSYDHGS